MTDPAEVTIIGVDYWADKPEQLAQLLATSRAPTIADPSGRPANPDHVAVFTLPTRWTREIRELQDALAFATSETGGPVTPGSRTAAGAVAPVEDRLVFTVEEAAQLLGICLLYTSRCV